MTTTDLDSKTKKTWTRRAFVRQTGLGLAALLSGTLTACSKEQAPNIVIIFTDDQGYGDVGCYGAQCFQTPNLDRMAQEGIRFTSFYVSEAVCSASRASLMTGCYAQRVSIHGALPARSKLGLHPNEETIAELLKERNYATGMFGKWHLGRLKEFLPINQGFDEYFGLPYSNDMWPYDYHGKRNNSFKIFANPPLRFIENDQPGELIDSLEDQAYLTQKYTHRAVNFIKKHKDQPFFLYLAHSMPHVPINASEKFKGKSAQGLYGDVIQEIDWSVGQIMQTLKDLGLDEKTLVIFTSDNGPWLNFGNWAGSAGPLREGKGTAWEGGVRVPCIMRWPGKIPAGRVTDQLASTLDLLPTICRLTGAPLPNRKIDGLDLSDFILGRSEKSPRKEFYYYYDGQLRAVRRGEWKLVFPHRYRSYEIVEPGNDGNPGPYAYQTCGVELYNLKNDVGERRDVAAQYQQIVKELQQLADSVRAELGDALTGVKGRAVREPGKKFKPRAENVPNLAQGKTLKLANPPSPRYSRGGIRVLLDGQLASDDFHDVRWLGFEGVDLEAVIDLGQVTPVKQLAISLLEDQVSWIFFPKKIDFFVSKDGKHYQHVKSLSTPVQPRPEPSVKIEKIDVKEEVRFVKVRAQNVAHCPEWHPGQGGKAWIFCDEILVQ